jgi:hypothetical protein
MCFVQMDHLADRKLPILGVVWMDCFCCCSCRSRYLVGQSARCPADHVDVLHCLVVLYDEGCWLMVDG